MGAGVVRHGSRGADDLDGGLVGAPLRFRRVSPSEADRICGSLAAVHLDALRSGMSLGALDTMGLAALERRYREVVASLDPAAHILLVGEEGGEIVAMGQLALSGATNADHRAEVQRVGVASSMRGRGIGRQLMEAVEKAALESRLTLLWLTTHEGADACAFYEAIGYTKLGVMPEYSRRPDGTLWPGAFYFKVLSA